MYVDALPETDFTAKALLEGLPPGQDVFYRTFVPGSRITEHYRRESDRPFPHRPRTTGVPFRFLWSGDTAGRGWGIDENARRDADLCDDARQPAGFLHPLAVTTSMPTARFTAAAENCRTAQVWKNIVTEEKSKVAETLAEFRGNYKYNLLDRNVRAFNAQSA